METLPKNRLAKILKIFRIVLALCVVAFVVLIAVVFYYLPSAKQLGSYFKKDKTSQQQVVENKPDKSETVSVNQLSEVSLKGAKHNTSILPAESIVEKKQPLEKLQEFLDDKTPAISFCGKLHFAKTGPIDGLTLPKSKENNTTRTELKTDGLEDNNDLRLEAIKPFFKAVLKQPEMQRLINLIVQDDEFRNSSEIRKEGLIDKALFYKQAYSAYSEMKENLPAYESVVDRSYLMYKLNDLIAFKPDLQNDPRIQKFCEESEYESNSYSPVNYENEKQVFERLIQELGVEASAIKYDPKYKTSLKLHFSGDNLQIDGGWLNELMPQEPQATTQ